MTIDTRDNEAVDDNNSDSTLDTDEQDGYSESSADGVEDDTTAGDDSSDDDIVYDDDDEDAENDDDEDDEDATALDDIFDELESSSTQKKKSSSDRPKAFKGLVEKAMLRVLDEDDSYDIGDIQYPKVRKEVAKRLGLDDDDDQSNASSEEAMRKIISEEKRKERLREELTSYYKQIAPKSRDAYKKALKQARARFEQLPDTEAWELHEWALRKSKAKLKPVTTDDDDDFDRGEIASARRKAGKMPAKSRTKTGSGTSISIDRLAKLAAKANKTGNYAEYNRVRDQIDQGKLRLT